MDRLTILVCRPNKSVTRTNYFFKVLIIGRFMLLVGVIRQLVESRLQARPGRPIHIKLTFMEQSFIQLIKIGLGITRLG